MKLSKVLFVLSCLALLACVANPMFAQTVTPTTITISGGPVCSGNSLNIPISITLPPGSVIDKVDVFLLFDDTGSFASFVPTVSSIFSNLVTSLETSLPGVEFGFGVGRFEDYGGPGAGFSGEFDVGRPFILNQPIVTAATAGGAAARNTLITTALSHTAPGYGGDGPESSVAEGLFQVGTGLGFDGDGDVLTSGSGAAGALATQTTPGTSGDVPAFSTNVLPTSGTQGGVGFRSSALHLVLLATDISSVAAFLAGSPIPATITGAGGVTVPVTAFAGSSITPGADRFGFVSNSKTLAGNTVVGAVVPSGAGTVQTTVNALNALGVRVMGMGPGAAPTSNPGPSFDESVWLSAMARLTGAVDATSTPLVFSTSVSLPALTTAIANAITTTTTLPVNISLNTTALPAGLSFAFTPPVVNGVAPGGTANFTVTLTGNGTPINGAFDIRFIDFGSSAVLGTIPTSITCATDLTPPSCILTGVIPGPPKRILVTVQDVGSGLASVVPVTLTNATLSVAPFTVGTTSAVLVTATKINQALAATIVLRSTDVAGNSVVCDPVYTTISADVPQDFALAANYPNPFNPTTTIHFNIAKSFAGGLVTLKVYDLLGREVKTLINDPMQGGQFSVQWDGTRDDGQLVPSGTYLYRLTAGEFVSTKKMTLMK